MKYIRGFTRNEIVMEMACKMFITNKGAKMMDPNP